MPNMLKETVKIYKITKNSYLFVNICVIVVKKKIKNKNIARVSFV